MRATITVLMILSLAGCGVDVLTSAAIRGKMEAQQMKQMQGIMQHTGDSTASMSLQRAVDAYTADKGVYPASLDVLVPEFLPNLPTAANGASFSYDPSTGRVGAPLTGAAAAAAGAATSDAALLQKVQQAVQAFGQNTGYYPVNLDVLTPGYLPTAPRTAAGQSLLYNPQTGQVALPGNAAVQQRPRPYSPNGTPMVDATTGLSVQRQLNSMGNSGVNSAGGYSRRNVGNINQQHNQRQNQALDEMGF